MTTLTHIRLVRLPVAQHRGEAQAWDRAPRSLDHVPLLTSGKLLAELALLTIMMRQDIVNDPAGTMAASRFTPRLDHHRQAGRPRLDANRLRRQAGVAFEGGYAKVKRGAWRHARSAGVGGAAGGARRGDEAQCGRMLDADKGYDFTIAFGERRPTRWICEGPVIATSARAARRGREVEAVLSRFIGPIEQVPPIYSALKVDGQARLRSGARRRGGGDEDAGGDGACACGRPHPFPSSRAKAGISRRRALS